MRMMFMFICFFSSGRRHTSMPRDWSSDVCSSELCGRRSDIVVVFLGQHEQVCGRLRIDIADCENSVRFAHHGRRGVARRYLTKNTVTFHALRLSLNACRCVSLRTGVHLKQAQGGASCAIWANEISERPVY